jgi:uncharacterized protein (TIGR03790 family)
MTKLILILLLIILCQSVAAFITVPDSYTNYDDVLLVTNTNSPDSVAISDYFKQVRPIVHEVLINCSNSETVSFIQFNNTIRKPIEDYLISNNLVDSINYIVTTKGIPLRYSGSPYITTSVDSALTLILSQYSYKLGALGNGTNYAGTIHNPYYYTDSTFSRSTYGIYLVTRLTGYTVDDVKQLISPTNTYINTGAILLDRNPTKSGGYAGWDKQIETASIALTANGISNIFDNTTRFIMNRGNLSGYVSWGSNDGNGPSNSSQWNLTFLPGSIGETAVSTSARSFQPGTTYGQSLIADLIHSGISGVKGYTDEPQLSAIARPNLFVWYSDGYNLADSFYMSSIYLGWRDVVVGDPKMRYIAPPPPEPPTYPVPDDLWQRPIPTLIQEICQVVQFSFC